MTAAELITELQKYPPDTRVFVPENYMDGDQEAKGVQFFEGDTTLLEVAHSLPEHAMKVQKRQAGLDKPRILIY